jgi:renal tumor antigen
VKPKFVVLLGKDYIICDFSLHPLFPGSNEVDQIAKIHDIMGTPEPNVLNKFKK